MSGFANNPSWLPPPHLRSLDSSNGSHSFDVHSSAGSRPRTPAMMIDSGHGSETGLHGDGDFGIEEDPKVKIFRESFARSDARLAALFGGPVQGSLGLGHVEIDGSGLQNHVQAVESMGSTSEAKRPTRTIDEDDYDDDEDDEDDSGIADASPLKGKGSGPMSVLDTSAPGTDKPPSSSKLTVDSIKTIGLQEQPKTVEEVRKKLEDDKKAAEDAAKRSFHTMFYTLENDRDAMLEQQKLDELDRQVDAEMSNGQGVNMAGSTSAGNEQHGKLSNANLGASSLTLKHLIARIDAKRDQVRASDAELRSLMSEVRKNRSKWAHEDKVGQEELYEAAEKVLNELKAHTEHSTAFLSRVNKREAPDYYHIIKQPMDLGSMTKKLKSIAYKSKKEFVDDLQLIWSNCLKYNAEPNHFLRKHALAMRKETEKLVPLIPDIVIRDRAEVEAEERRLQNGDGDLDAGEDSDDEPIMSSRGRAAPGKTAKKGAGVARKAPETSGNDTPGPESKPSLNILGVASASNRTEYLRADSDAPHEGSVNGLSTPPLGGQGSMTPAGANGMIASGAPGSQTDGMDLDGPSVNGLTFNQGLGVSTEDPENDDLEYKTWKQVTKKDRALVAAERHRLFKGDKINADEPALLRTKAGMRRWDRQQRQALVDGASGNDAAALEERSSGETAKAGETLAEGMEGDEERVLPDYYDALAVVPKISDRLKWTEDSEGQVIDRAEECLRVVPKGYFTAPESALNAKVDANIRQMQETRRVCSKIGVIKQMQVQSQMYQNQFQKYNPEKFIEQDIGPHVVSGDGPIMSPWVCRAALQRSVGKLLYHTGFEEFQPSALEVITDIAGDFFTKLVETLAVYREAPKVPVSRTATGMDVDGQEWQNKFTTEETVLHCLYENGLDVQSLESYVNEDTDRLASKLGTMHERMKSHLADLLRPALGDAGPDGSNAFNDGSEQFVGGDFAEDLDEDFFGFKELGLDKEFGMASLSVPLHLLQNRMHNQYQAQNASNAISAANILEAPPAYEPVTLINLKNQIGLVQNFFLAKLHANNDEPLVEDEDLPQKQRFPKPRLPPSGKISSPRKRPPKEQGGNKSKKKKTEHTTSVAPPLLGKLKLAMPGSVAMERNDSNRISDGDKDNESGGGLMSPESMEIAAA